MRADGKRAIIAFTMGRKRRRRRTPVETETQSPNWNELQLRESESRAEAWADDAWSGEHRVDDSVPGWRRAKRALESAFDGIAPLSKVRLGRVVKIGEGLDRQVFAAAVELVPDPQELSGTYVARIPHRRVSPDVHRCTIVESKLLTRLAAFELPFDIPRAVAIASESGVPVMVQQFAYGVPLAMCAGRQPNGIRPWEIQGRIAAQVHAIDPEIVSDIVPGAVTLRAHAIAAMRVLDGEGPVELRDAHAWAAAHLPPDEPCRLVHGDLLAQNIILGERPIVLDWDRAVLGHPAADIAILTRGVRRPFHIESGLQKLLDAYHASGGVLITNEAVRFYEICMVAGWYRSTVASDPQSHEIHEHLHKIRRLLDRADRGS